MKEPKLEEGVKSPEMENEEEENTNILDKLLKDKKKIGKKKLVEVE